MGVPLSASRCRPCSSRAALADSLFAFLIACDSSKMQKSNGTSLSNSTSRRKVP